MRDVIQNPDDAALAKRSRTLFHDSVEGVDFATRSRLTQARHAALAAAGARTRPRWLLMTIWKPAAGMAAVALLGVALWFGPLSGNLSGSHGIADNQTNLEDLDIVASSDPGSGDAIEMLQDDIEFYDFADKATSAGPAA